MNESVEKRETIDSEALVLEIQEARAFSLTSYERNNFWNESVAAWDVVFKKNLVAEFGTTRFAQQVPAWQVLVGGSVETETDITHVQRNYIVTEVNTFFSRIKKELELY